MKKELQGYNKWSKENIITFSGSISEVTLNGCFKAQSKAVLILITDIKSMYIKVSWYSDLHKMMS